MPLKSLKKDAICSLCQCHIRGNALFADLSDSELEAFKDAVTVSSCRKREIIFLGGDRTTGIYIIRKGRVKMVKSSPSGKEQIIKILNPGDLLGFEVLYDAGTYANTAVAMEDCELCHIKTSDFFRILERTEPPGPSPFGGQNFRPCFLPYLHSALVCQFVEFLPLIFSGLSRGDL